MGFLEYSGVSLVNKQFSPGVPTYEIAGKKRSLIDVCLTNAIHHIRSFVVLPIILGVSPQTCHKAIKMVITNSLRVNPEPIANRVSAYRFCTFENLEKVRGLVATDIDDLIHIRKGYKSPVPFFNYKVLVKLYAKAKAKLLGFVKNRNQTEVPSQKILEFQHKIRLATALYLRDKSDLMLLRLQILNKQMEDQYLREKHNRSLLIMLKAGQL